MLISHCKMSPTHHTVLSQWYWMISFAMPLSRQNGPPNHRPHPHPHPTTRHSISLAGFIIFNTICHVGVIIWYDVIRPRVSKWLPHTMQYSLINIECMHLLSLVWSQTYHDVINISGWVHCNIFYRCDRIAWCVGHILQHEISIPGAISWYYKITPLSHLEEI